MKRILALLLAAMMLLSLAACERDDTPTTTASKPGESNPTSSSTSTPTTPEEPDVLSVLTDAIAKTMSAKSYVMQHGMVAEFQGEEFEDLTTVMVSKATDGTLTALSTKSAYIYDYQDYIDDIIYVCGNVAYQQDAYIVPTRCYKHISDTSFGVDMVVDPSNYTEMFPNENLLSDFVAQTPVVTESDGETVYTISGIEIIYQVMSGTPWPEDQAPEMDGMQYEGVFLSMRVNAKGYFSGFSLDMKLYDAESDMHATQNLVMSIDKLDEEVTIEEPAFIAETKQWDEYHIHENGYEAVYTVDTDYDGEYTERLGKICVFRGMVYDRNDPPIIPVYKVLAEIDGIPVAFVLSYDDYPYIACIEKLIMPKGVSFGIRHCDGMHPDTELYFESTEEELNNYIYVIGNEYDGWGQGVKAAYYAGEWEYVDGIPTPIE